MTVAPQVVEFIAGVTGKEGVGYTPPPDPLRALPGWVEAWEVLKPSSKPDSSDNCFSFFTINDGGGVDLL